MPIFGCFSASYSGFRASHFRPILARLREAPGDSGVQVSSRGMCRPLATPHADKGLLETNTVHVAELEVDAVVVIFAPETLQAPNRVVLPCTATARFGRRQT